MKPCEDCLAVQNFSFEPRCQGALCAGCAEKLAERVRELEALARLYADEITRLRAELGDAELDRDRVRGLSVREITILTERLQSEAARCEDLRVQVKRLEGVVEAARELKEILSDRDYEPDSFTTQPLRVALAKLDEVRKGDGNG